MNKKPTELLVPSPTLSDPAVNKKFLRNDLKFFVPKLPHHGDS